MSKKQKKFIASLVMVSLVMAIYGYFPSPNSANATDSLKDAKVLITDSAYEVNATSTFTFLSATSTEIGGFIDVVYPSDFGTFVDTQVTCPSVDYTASVIGGGRTARCTRINSIAVAGARTIVVSNVTNPALGAGNGKVFNISLYKNATDLAEQVQVMVALISNVLMTARVDATLQFTIAGTSTGATVNSLTCTATSTATSTPFGTLIVGQRHNVCQELRVITNASDGFTVTVEEDSEMTSDGGDNINSFDNSGDTLGSSTAHVWAMPQGILDQDYTYGHMGLTSDDTDLSTLGGYTDTNFYNGGTPQFAGLTASIPMPVYHHDGPADGLTQDKGRVMVLYSAEINALQQAGDYQNTITYIATPTY